MIVIIIFVIGAWITLAVTAAALFILDCEITRRRKAGRS